MTDFTRSKDQTRSAYDRMSRWYDLFAGFESRHRTLGLCKLNPRQGEQILEIGVGTGRSLQALAVAVGASGMVYGIDISQGMLEESRRRLTQAGLVDRIVLECGDAANLPFEAGFFDGVFMSFTLELFGPPEIPVVLSACRRVLKTGGRICVVAMSKKDKPNLVTHLYCWFHKKLPDYVDCRPIHVQEAIRSAGFRLIDATELSLFGLSDAIVLAAKGDSS